jgi:hypothetical protein
MAADIDHFIQQGYLKIEGAFPRALADEARALLWRDSGCDPDDPATWTRPVVRLGDYAQPLFREAANTPVLHEAFDRLVGFGRWQPRGSLGTFPLRFPSQEDPGDAGWHIDPSFDFGLPDFMDWRTNIVSRGRALLMLFLFSDVGETDAPTRLRPGSHMAIARRLAPYGESGLTLRDLAADDFAAAECKTEAVATGEAGTVYLCHPFLVHSAQQHRGLEPRFMAQPPLLPAESFALARPDGDYSPVEQAIRQALA